MSDPKTENAWVRLGTDLGPLIVFIVAYWRGGVFVATAAFMVAIVAAVIVSKLNFGKVSPMLWFSAIMVLVLGGLTLWLHDQTFIKMKPTIYYGTVAAFLGFGYLTGRPLLKSVLGNAYPELNDDGWALLGRNFAIFFAGMALLNELIWRNSSDAFWIASKLWLFFPLTIAFGLANLPMILKHSTGGGAEPPLPPSA